MKREELELFARKAAKGLASPRNNSSVQVTSISASSISPMIELIYQAAPLESIVRFP